MSTHSLSSLRHALTPTGTLVPNGGRFDNHWFAGGGRVISALVLSKLVSQTLQPFILSPKLADLVTLRELLEAGTLRPILDRPFTLSETPQALGYVGLGHARGKVAITV